MQINELKQQLEGCRENIGIHEFGFLPCAEISITDQVRELCALNYCGHFNGCWACPPAVGTVEQCRERLKQYSTVFVYTTLHMLEDSYDYEGMIKGRKEHAQISSRVIERFRELVQGDMLVLAGDGCTHCAKCTYPHAPCRFPEKMTPAVESYGVEVNRLAESAGVKYINGKNTVTYFGCIFFNL